MAERVHPITVDAPPRPPPPPSSREKNSGDAIQPPKLEPNTKPVPPPPPPSTYVVQLPREQVLRYPPPENALKFHARTHRSKRSCGRRCCYFTLCLLLLVIVSAAIAAGVLYLVFRPEAPKYTITSVVIKGMDLKVPFTSPEFDVSIRAENPNDKIGIYYSKNSVVNVFYNDVKLSDGVLPSFYQPKNNVTVFQTALKGSNIVLGSAVKTSLRNGQNENRVPLVMRSKVPVKFKVGSMKTWEIKMKVKCDVIVDSLNDKSNIVSEDCDYSVRLW